MARESETNPYEPDSCLDERRVVEFAVGRWVPEDAQALWKHVTLCQRCTAVVNTSGARLLAPTLEQPHEARNGAARGASPAGAPAERQSRVPLESGRSLDDTYSIVRFLGRGAMGDVFEVRHARLAGRYAAKLLAPDLTDNARALSRFRREALIASGLNHPNIVQVIDFRDLPDGRPCLVMEYLDGSDLAAVMAQGPLSLDRVLRFTRQIASALSALHAHRIVHRDLKPQNIFVLPGIEGEPERVKLADFGLAKRPNPSLALTRDGTLLGTPQYMTPEQAMGFAEKAGPEADQFSLAAIVYEMLAGRPAFDGDQLSAVLYRVVHEQPQPLGQIAPLVPSHVVRAVERGLSKDPKVRFPSVKEFLRELEAAPSAWAAPSDPALARRRLVRRSHQMLLIGPVVIAVLGVIFGSLRHAGGNHTAAAADHPSAARERPRRAVLTDEPPMIAPASVHAAPAVIAAALVAPAKARPTGRPALAPAKASPEAAAPVAGEIGIDEKAARLAREAEAAADAGDLGDALRLYQAAYSLLPSPSLLLGMGRCEEGMGRRVQAMRHYSVALGEGHLRGAMRNHVEALVRALAAQLVSVEIMGAPRKALVQVDGATAGTTPLELPLWVDPGPHRISIKPPGSSPWTTAIREEAGVIVSLSVPDLWTSNQLTAGGRSR